MEKFKDAVCPICEKPFDDGEQIAVCPECGAPYHKKCIDVTGKCIFDNLHSEGKSWTNPNEKASAESENPNKKICSRCGSANPASGLFCENCGNPSNSPQNAYYQNTQNNAQNFQNVYGQYGFNTQGFGMFASPFGNVNPDEELNGIKVKDYSVFIGQNMHYFVPKFKNMALKIGRAGFNFAAMLFGGFYFLYRKMYGIGILLLIWFAVLRIPDFLYSIDYARQMLDSSVELLFDQNTLESLSMLTTIPYYLTHLLCGFFANRLYFSHSVRSIKKINSLNLNTQDYVLSLRKKGGVVQNLVLIVFVVYFLISFVMAFALMYTM